VSKQAFDRKIAEIEALRSGGEAVAGQLRKALKDRNNYVVSKAAAVIADLQIRELCPDLVAAFGRFLTDPLKSDPQCWAKNAIAKALKNLSHRDPAVFLRGLTHAQLEPVWGGRQDSAGTLRATCAHALVETDLTAFEALTHIADLMADPEKPVRIDAARAIAQLGLPAGAIVLRLKALLGDSDPEVTGECFAALLSLAPESSPAFLARFLNPAAGEVAAEAAAVLAQSHDPAALDMAIEYWRRTPDPELRRTIIAALGASSHQHAAEFLVSLLAGSSVDFAKAALQALAARRYSSAMREPIGHTLSDRNDPVLKDLFGRLFPSG
jgi:HEAT repeat protein